MARQPNSNNGSHSEMARKSAAEPVVVSDTCINKRRFPGLPHLHANAWQHCKQHSTMDLRCDRTKAPDVDLLGRAWARINL